MRFVLLGDSHSSGAGSPGGLLAKLLRRRGHTVTVNAKGGRSAASFLRTEDGAEVMVELADDHPDVVLVFLGTNDIGRGVKATRAAMEVIRKSFSSSVVAIGPPYWPEGTDGERLNAGALDVFALEREVFTSAIDSIPLTRDIGVDGRAKTATGSVGIHFNAKGAATWAKRLYLAILPAKRRPLWMTFLGVGVGLLTLRWLWRSER